MEQKSKGLSLKDLEYIALEGGGGKGAVYKGAVEALEEIFKKEWEKGTYNRKTKDGFVENETPAITTINEAVKHHSSKFTKIAMLDYYVDSDLKIKGIAGASAGAITAFPLALGLNSEDINQILETYPFNEEFLPNNELHIGKYRMIGMDKDGKAKILIAEDALKKLGEKNIEEYKYSANKKIKVGSNQVKSIIRNQILSLVISIIFVGIKNKSENVKNIIEYIQKILQWPKEWFATQVNSLDFIAKFNITSLPNVLFSISKATLISLFKKLKIKPNQWKTIDILPTNNLISGIGNILWDRGVYSGFEVRDFFFKILILALSKDTHFRRGLIENDNLLTKLRLSKKQIEDFSVRFNEKFEAETTGASTQTLELLKKLPEILTFKEFKEITKINFSLCVTNSTTNQPIYFSFYFTPNFPVTEAVGSSMSFPLAFKSVYNEADVLHNPYIQKIKDYFSFSPSKDNEAIYKTLFSARDYNYYLNLVLKIVKDEEKLKMSTNGNLSFRSFLPYLRKIIDGNSALSDFEKALLIFYYNSAFKGLLIDGGVTNNLPTNIFSYTTDNNIDKPQDFSVKQKILSLKLDRSFPDEFKEMVFNVLKEDKSGKTIEKLSNWQDKLGAFTFIKKVKKDLYLKKAFNRISKEETLDDKLLSLSEEVWIKICKELVDEYKLSKKGYTPWNKQVFAVSGLIDSLQFGFDQAQIENISDNENIIPLYCYGIGTLDFDLTAKEMKPLVKIANENSKKDVFSYFGYNQGA